MSAPAPHYPPPRIQTFKVCPHCKVELPPPYAFKTAEDVNIAAYRCSRCGDVVPMRSVVRNHAVPLV